MPGTSSTERRELDPHAMTAHSCLHLLEELLIAPGSDAMGSAHADRRADRTEAMSDAQIDRRPDVLGGGVALDEGCRHRVLDGIAGRVKHDNVAVGGST